MDRLSKCCELDHSSFARRVSSRAILFQLAPGKTYETEFAMDSLGIRLCVGVGVGRTKWWPYDHRHGVP